MPSRNLQSTPDFNFLRLSIPSNAVCHIQLDRAPVNALNTALWTELSDALHYIETQQFPHTIRVLVFSSAARAQIFSAGNDLNELHAPSSTRAQFTTFWLTSTNFLARLYKSPLYTIAALRGATPAGGCAIAMCCDRRLAHKNTTIGLNEVAIGLPVPNYWARLLVMLVVPRARAEQMLMSGEMVDADEAQRIGLVHHVSPDTEQLMQRAFLVADSYAAQTDVMGRAQTKSSLRAQFADDWQAYGPEEARKAWQQLSQPARAKVVAAVMKRLATRASAKL